MIHGEESSDDQAPSNVCHVTTALIPANDHERLQAVRRYDILDTPPDGAFDRVTTLAARIFDVPIAVVSIVDEDRIWFKSRYGLDDVHEIPRDPGLCASAIWDSDVYVVESADTDARTRANPLVAGESGLRFYAAAPLQTADGFRLGNVAILDHKPRTLTPSERTMLSTLAGIVMDELELRLQAIRTVSEERALREEASRQAVQQADLYKREHRILTTLQTAMLPSAFPSVATLRFDAIYVPAGAESEIGGDWYDAFLVDPTHVALSIGDVGGHGLYAATIMHALRQSLRAFALVERSPVRLLALLDAMLHNESAETIATAFVCLIDLDTRMMVYANAGHPAPLLRLADASIHEVLAEGPCLGLQLARNASDDTAYLPANSTLLMYTDGLTEFTRDIIQGEERLKASFARPEIAEAERPAQALGDALLPTPPLDDVAIITVSID